MFCFAESVICGFDSNPMKKLPLLTTQSWQILKQLISLHSKQILSFQSLYQYVATCPQEIYSRIIQIPPPPIINQITRFLMHYFTNKSYMYILQSYYHIFPYIFYHRVHKCSIYTTYLINLYTCATIPTNFIPGAQINIFLKQKHLISLL